MSDQLQMTDGMHIIVEALKQEIILTSLLRYKWRNEKCLQRHKTVTVYGVR